MQLFAVVYGTEWDAIEYFSKYHVACNELYAHTRTWTMTHDFYPMLMHMIQDPLTGRFIKEFAQYLDPMSMIETQDRAKPSFAHIQTMLRKLE